jgi:Ca2+-binding EF-hand superfamily protein
MDSNKDGLFSREQLQQALLYNGSNLSTSEFNLLYDNLPKTYKDNKVDMNSFHPDLLKHVDRFREHTNMIIDKKKTSLGVSKTFRESDDFIVTNNQASYTEYQPINHTLDTYYRKGEHNKRFSRLTSILNDNASKVLCAFSSNTTADNSSGSRSGADIALSKYINDVAKSGVMKEKLRDVSIDELQKHLSNAGLVLTESDYLNVKNHLKRSSSASRNSRSSAVDDIGRATIDESKVSLEEFCNAMKIPLMITDKAVVGQLITI